MIGNSVSVIISVHNSAGHLAEAISSVLAQDEPPMQIMVIDDGSIDATGRIARRFPVHYYRQQRLGLAAARNRGVEFAKGGFVAFLDAEDLWLPAKLYRQLEAFDQDPDLDLVGGHVVPLQDQSDSLDQPEASYQWGAVLVRRPAFMQVGPIDTGSEIDEAVDWFVRARNAELKIGMIPDVVLRHRQPVAAVLDPVCEYPAYRRAA